MMDLDGDVKQLVDYMMKHLPEMRGGDSYREFFDALPQAIRIQSDKFVTLDCNLAFCELVGQPREALIGRSIDAYMPPAVRTQGQMAIRTVRAELERQGYTSARSMVERPDGSVAEVVMRFQRASLNGKTVIIGLYWLRSDLLKAIDSPKIVSSSALGKDGSVTM